MLGILFLLQNDVNDFEFCFIRHLKGAYNYCEEVQRIV